MNKFIKIGWWSAGITSTVVCKIALERYDNVRLYYIDTGKAHPDNARFKAECERWYGQEIITVKNKKGYENPIDVIYRDRYINGPAGARCTKVLKKEVREELENHFNGGDLFEERPRIENQIFGFEFDKKQINRAIRFLQQYPAAHALMPLIEKGITKDNCAAIIMKAGIELPTMYKLGYSNNNCIGCVKGGMAYWNKIRNDFPETFRETAEAERAINATCINGLFLDELDPSAGRQTKIITPECGTFCDIDFANLPDKNLSNVIEGKMTIYEAAA